MVEGKKIGFVGSGNMAEALIRSLSMHMEITTIFSSVCVGIDCLSEPFNVG